MVDTTANTTYLTVLYILFFQRLPQDSEVAFYLNALTNGTTLDQILTFFRASRENQLQINTFTGTAVDVANRENIRNANFSGGTPGYVNGLNRNITNISSGVTSFEWVLTNILNSAANSGENVACYNQSNGTGTGEIWGGVNEVNQTHDAPAIGLEIDIRKPSGNADGLGIDIVNESGMTAAIQCGDGDIVLRNRTYNGKSGQSFTGIKFTSGGGIQIIVRGNIVGNWA